MKRTSELNAIQEIGDHDKRIAGDESLPRSVRRAAWLRHNRRTSPDVALRNKQHGEDLR